MTVEAPRDPEIRPIRTLLEINYRAARDGRLADMVRGDLAREGRKPTPEETAWLEHLDTLDAERAAVKTAGEQARHNARGAGRHATKRDALVERLIEDRAAGVISDADIEAAVRHPTSKKTALVQRYWSYDPRMLAVAAQIVLAESLR